MSAIDPTTHIHVSEREPDGSWEDCIWDSGLEFYRDAIDPAPPATHTEAQALRKASGEPATGPSNMGNFRKGVAARYHKALPAAIAAKGILAALRPGDVALVTGSMSAFGAADPLSAWDRNFDGGHAVWLARTPDGVLLWCDPEAPTTAGVPITVTSEQVQKFVNALVGGEALVAPALQWPAVTPGAGGAVEPAMRPIFQPLVGYTAVIKAGARIRSEPLIAVKFVTLPADLPVKNVIGYVKGDTDPSNGKNEWLGWLSADLWRFTAAKNVASVTAPVFEDGYTKSTQEAAVKVAVEAQKQADQAAIDAANAATAKAQVDLGNAAAVERERLALAIGAAEAEKVRNS